MIGFAGDSHMAAIMRSAAHIKGLETSAKDFDKCDLVFIAQDVNSDADLAVFNKLVETLGQIIPENVPVVITSQVPVGTTAKLLTMASTETVFYQVDTIIMNQALERAIGPEQLIVGSADPDAPLPESYMLYLNVFNVPIVRMTITEAELTKHAINFYLAAQLSATKALKDIADQVGADWNHIIPALRNDKRIGPLAYVVPPVGLIGGHLPRDVYRLQEIRKSPFTGAIVLNCEGP